MIILNNIYFINLIVRLLGEKYSEQLLEAPEGVLKKIGWGNSVWEWEAHPAICHASVSVAST